MGEILFRHADGEITIAGEDVVIMIRGRMRGFFGERLTTREKRIPVRELLFFAHFLPDKDGAAVASFTPENESDDLLRGTHYVDRFRRSVRRLKSGVIGVGQSPREVRSDGV